MYPVQNLEVAADILGRARTTLIQSGVAPGERVQAVLDEVCYAFLLMCAATTKTLDDSFEVEPLTACELCVFLALVEKLVFWPASRAGLAQLVRRIPDWLLEAAYKAPYADWQGLKDARLAFIRVTFQANERRRGLIGSAQAAFAAVDALLWEPN